MKRINLISGPRNVSTALLYSFAQRADTEVVDEPFYAHYLHLSNVDHPGKKEVLQSQQTDPAAVVREVIMKPYSSHVLFIKNMAHHLEFVEWDFLHRVRNIFLIRDPEEMLTSLMKNISDPTMRDTAYKHQIDLFNYLTEKAGRSPVVLDSRELLLDPEQVLRQVCKRLEISFDPGMLSWEPGPVPEDGVWAKYWYNNVHQSTGFEPYSPKDETVSSRYGELLERCKTYYNYLYKHAIKAE